MGTVGLDTSRTGIMAQRNPNNKVLTTNSQNVSPNHDLKVSHNTSAINPPNIFLISTAPAKAVTPSEVDPPAKDPAAVAIPEEVTPAISIPEVDPPARDPREVTPAISIPAVDPPARDPREVTPAISIPAKDPAEIALAAVEVAKAEDVNAKPVVEVKISEYFKTTFNDLEERFTLIGDQRAIMTGVYDQSDLMLIPPLRLLQGKPKTIETLLGIQEETQKTYKEGIARAFQSLREDGVTPSDSNNPPKWICEEADLVAKGLVFSYSSRMRYRDGGMDMDYMTTPVIEDDKIPDDEKSKTMFKYYPITTSLFKYDSLLKEYNGVGTRGSLGKNLGLGVVELRNLWKELGKAGLLIDYKFDRKDPAGGFLVEAITIRNLFLEVGSNINVEELVEGLNVDSNYKARLVNYLKSLQTGKKINEGFNVKYEELKKEYKGANVLQATYYDLAYYTLRFAKISSADDAYSKEFRPIAIAWLREYAAIESEINDKLYKLSTQSGNDISTADIDSYLKEIKEKFKGEIPLGSEFLMLLMMSLDEMPQADLDVGKYQLILK